MHATPAPHQPPGRDRRIDAAREQADDPPAHADRQPARARVLAEEVERLVRQRLDVDGQLGVVQIDVPPARLLDPPADFALDLRRGHRKPLVGAPHRHAERSRVFGIEIAQDLAGDRVDVERCPSRAGEVPGTEHLRQAIPHAGPVGAITEDDLDAPLEGAHLPDVEVRRRLPDVPDEPRHEPRPVLPLERDLRVVNDDGLHEMLNSEC